MTETLETVTVQETAEVEALKSTVKALREEIKGQAANPRELSRRELLYNLGKGISAAWTGNHKTLADLAFSPNLKSENWTNPRDVSWGEKGWHISKAAGGGSPLGDPMGNMATNEQYLINPIYETEIMQDVAKQSVMMSLVRHRPMTGTSIFLPTRDRGGVQLNWLTAYGQKIEESKPKGAERVEFKAHTLAGTFRGLVNLKKMFLLTSAPFSLMSLSKPTGSSLTANASWRTVIRLPGLLLVPM